MFEGLNPSIFGLMKTYFWNKMAPQHFDNHIIKRSSSAAFWLRMVLFCTLPLLGLVHFAYAQDELYEFRDPRYAEIDSLEAALNKLTDPIERINMHLLIGERYKDIGDRLAQARANQSFIRAQIIAEEIGDQGYVALTYAYLGLLIEYSDKFLPDGVVYCHKAYDLARKVGDLRAMRLSCFCLAALNLKLLKLEEALKYAQLAVQHSNEAKQPRWATTSLILTGRILYKLKRTAEAKQTFLQAETLVMESDSKPLKADFYYSLMYSVDNPVEELSYAKLMVANTEPSNYQRLFEGHSKIGAAFRILGQSDSALNHYVYALNYNNLLCDTESERQLAIAQTKFQTGYTKVQNQLLSAQLDTRNIILFSIAGTVAMLIVILSLIYYTRRKRQQNESLQRELAFKQQLHEQQLRTEQEKNERERIAMQIELERQETLRKEQELQTDLQVAAERLMERRSILADFEEQLDQVVEASTRARLDQLKMLHRSIRQALAEPKDQEMVNQYLISANMSFLQNLMERFPDLSPAEQRLCILLRFDKSSKDIASLTYTSLESVNVARSRLRKKLNIERTEDIGSFLRSF